MLKSRPKDKSEQRYHAKSLSTALCEDADSDLVLTLFVTASVAEVISTEKNRLLLPIYFGVLNAFVYLTCPVANTITDTGILQTYVYNGTAFCDLLLFLMNALLLFAALYHSHSVTQLCVQRYELDDTITLRLACKNGLLHLSCLSLIDFLLFTTVL